MGAGSSYVLEGQETDLRKHVGHKVEVTGTVNGPGGTTLFGEESGGSDHTATQSHDGGTDVPELTLDLELEVGHIEVRTR